MAKTGLFRTAEGSAQVDYDGIDIPIPRSKYEEEGYTPDFDQLPLEADYWAAQEEARKREAQKPAPRLRRGSANAWPQSPRP